MSAQSRHALTQEREHTLRDILRGPSHRVLGVPCDRVREDLLRKIVGATVGAVERAEMSKTASIVVRDQTSRDSRGGHALETDGEADLDLTVSDLVRNGRDSHQARRAESAGPFEKGRESQIRGIGKSRA